MGKGGGVGGHITKGWLVSEGKVTGRILVRLG